MTDLMMSCSLGIVLAPLLGCILAGLFGHRIGRSGAHWVTILGVAVAFVLSSTILYQMLFAGLEPQNLTLYTWAVIPGKEGGVFQIGFLIDRLTTLMMVVVSFISLMVHIYTIGYMRDDPGYQRFFSYIALFTFSMLMLVMANNFLQLFFGWEAVGMVSYLLIGFWYQRESAIFANLKAFLVNRVGDFGFLLGIAAIYLYFGSLDYAQVFAKVTAIAGLEQTITLLPGLHLSILNATCILLFIGAMGKSAQIPLHVWLPDSMEGPTPISALIHAATMVTAGVFMVARLSPLFEYAPGARSMVLIIGATTALFMGLLGIVNNDIKRIIAYSTLSQLGYMMTALGASAYAVGIFHLMTHAFFKALLFLGAGSVIIAMHHEQDIRKMGNLRKYLPITYITMLIGSLALAGIPPFAGFFSKDMIIEAVALTHLPGSSFAYFAVTSSVFVTALYSFRLFFYVFHSKERMSDSLRAQLHETPLVVCGPLILLAIGSAVVGALTIAPLLFTDPGYFKESIFVLAKNNVLTEMGKEFHGIGKMSSHAFFHLPFWLAIGGIGVAWLFYVRSPQLPEKISQRWAWLHQFMLRKYGFDEFNQRVFANGARCLGGMLWRFGDQKVIDGVLVNGTANSVGWLAQRIRRLQTGYLYHYAFAMVAGLFVFMVVLIMS